MTTLPTLTETIDDYFVSTWYEIRAQATDNILDANVITAALRRLGCFDTQVGGRKIERTISYGQVSKQNYKKGDTLSSSEPELETAAFWNWKYTLAPVRRSFQDDQQNAGPLKIKDYVKRRIKAARDGLNTGFETDLLAAEDTGEGADMRATRDPDNILNFLPTETNAVAGKTYGGIDFGNAWWGGQYNDATDPTEVNLIADMRTLYNDCGAQVSYPKIIICEQAVFELYEDFGVGKIQIVKDAGTELVDLGFEVLRFKGKPLVYSSNCPSNTMLMLNTDFIELIYDPNVWFSMTNWKDLEGQLERVAYIICAYNMLCTQLRRQGRLDGLTV